MKCYACIATYDAYKAATYICIQAGHLGMYV